MSDEYIGVYKEKKIVFCGKIFKRYGNDVIYEPITEDDVLVLKMNWLENSFLLIDNDREFTKTNIEAIKRDGFIVYIIDNPEIFLEDLSNNLYLKEKELPEWDENEKSWLLNVTPI